jgi:hypothetical protein
MMAGGLVMLFYPGYSFREKANIIRLTLSGFDGKEAE